MFQYVNSVECTCEKCGHKWITEVAGDGMLPRRCSKCKSRMWNGKPIPEWQTENKAPLVYLRPEPPIEPHKNEGVTPGSVIFGRLKHAATCKCFICKPPKE